MIQIQKLIQPIRNGHSDLTIGSRFLKADSQIPLLISIANRLMAVFLSLFAGVRLRDVESGFRALSYQAASDLKLLGLDSSSHEMILDLRWKGYRIYEVPVVVKYFDGRVSRVVKGLLNYGFIAISSIFLKILSRTGLYSKPIDHNNHIQLVYVSDKLKEKTSKKKPII